MSVEDKKDELEDETGGAQAGSGSGDDNSGGDSAGSQASGGSGSQEKTFTQTQVNKMMSNEKHQGKNAAFRALGIDPSNKELLNSVKAFVASQSKQSDEDDANAELQQQLASANALVEVMKAGVKPQYADDAVALALAKSQRDDSSIEEAMSEYKQKYPEWFAPESADDDGDDKSKKDESGKQFTGTGSTPPAGGKKQTDDKSASGIGKRLAASRKKPAQKSYWN